MFKSEYSKIIFYLFILVGVIQTQNQDVSNLDMLFPEDIIELENEIRMEKFDRILPRVMRDVGLLVKLFSNTILPTFLLQLSNTFWFVIII